LANREDECEAMPDLMHERMKRETIAHLRDIGREHGAGHHWVSVALSRGLARFVPRPSLYSSCGSPAAHCVDLGERKTGSERGHD
jgi:hypothetical protein